MYVFVILRPNESNRLDRSRSTPTKQNIVEKHNVQPLIRSSLIGEWELTRLPRIPSGRGRLWDRVREVGSKRTMDLRLRQAFLGIHPSV